MSRFGAALGSVAGAMLGGAAGTVAGGAIFGDPEEAPGARDSDIVVMTGLGVVIGGALGAAVGAGEDTKKIEVTGVEGLPNDARGLFP